MAKGYQKHSRGGSFKRQDFGDLGLRSLKDQQSEIIEALKLQRLRSEQYGSEYTQGLKGVAASEKENKELIQDLETKAYQTRLDAIEVKADREIDAIKGQAKLAGDKAEYWSNFSTTYAKEWGKLAQGLRHYADVRFAEEQRKSPEFQQNWAKFAGGMLELENKEKDNLDRDTSTEPNADLALENNAQRLHSSDSFSKVIAYKYGIDKAQILNNFRSETTEKTFTEAGARKWFRENLIKLGLNPDIPSSVKLTNKFAATVRAEINLKDDIETANKHQLLFQKHMTTFEADPTEKNWHAVVQHARTMYIYDEDTGKVDKPVANEKRNPARSWFYSADEFRKFVPKNSPFKKDYSYFYKRVFNINRLRDEKTGEPSTILFSVPHANQISNWETDVFVPSAKQQIEAEEAAVKTNEVLLPISNLKAEIAEKGNEATIHDYSPGGWVYTNLKAIRAKNNPELTSAYHELLGFNEEDHKEFAKFEEIMSLGPCTTLECTSRKMWLINRLNRTYGAPTVEAYAKIDGIGINAQRIVEAGTFRDSTFTTFGENLVREVARDENLKNGGGRLTANGQETVRRINAYRNRLFSTLDPNDYKTPYDQMVAAQKETETVFRQGLPKDKFKKGDSGTGPFKATVPAGKKGKMYVTWDGWDAGSEGNKVKTDYSSMVETVSSLTTQDGRDKFIESEGVITRDEATAIVTAVIRGEWDGKIPENVKNYSSIIGRDPSQTLNYLLKFFGHDISVPVTALDQIKASGVFADSEVPSERHTPTMLLWTKFMQLYAQSENPERPNFGPIDVTNIIEKQKEAARNTITQIKEREERINNLLNDWPLGDYHFRST